MSEIPGDLKFLKSHEWARVEDNGRVTVGISDHAQGLLGDLVYVELPNVGDSVEQGGATAVVESVKAASDVYSPVAGKIVEVNSALSDKPETINEDAYGEGWIFVIEPSEPDQLAELLSPDDYAELLEEEGHSPGDPPAESLPDRPPSAAGFFFSPRKSAQFGVLRCAKPPAGEFFFAPAPPFPRRIAPGREGDSAGRGFRARVEDESQFPDVFFRRRFSDASPGNTAGRSHPHSTGVIGRSPLENFSAKLLTSKNPVISFRRNITTAEASDQERVDNASQHTGLQPDLRVGGSGQTSLREIETVLPQRTPFPRPGRPRPGRLCFRRRPAPARIRPPRILRGGGAPRDSSRGGAFVTGQSKSQLTRS